MGTFCGIRGSDDFPLTTDSMPFFRQFDWRNMELYLRPNGAAMLTALSSLSPGESLVDPKFYWIEREYALRAGAVTALYDDFALSTAYTDAADSAGFVCYAKVAAATAQKFVAGDVVMLCDKDDYRHNTRAKVLAVFVNGASSVLTLRLLEDSNGHDAVYLGAVDYIFVVGSAHPEGSTLPDPRIEDPTEVENYSQIFMRSAEITRTAASISNLRVKRGLAEAKAQALEQLNADIETSLLFGLKKLSTGANGHPERYSDGIVSFITKRNTALNDSANPLVDDYKTTALISGASTWLAGGKEWLDYHLMKALEYGEDDERLCLCGNGAMLAIQKLVMEHGDYQIGETTKVFGFQVTRFRNVFGTLNLKIHPMFNLNPLMNNAMLWIDPKTIKQRDLLKPTWIGPNSGKSPQTSVGNGYQFIDAVKGGFLAEIGFEMHHVRRAKLLYNVGQDKAS